MANEVKHPLKGPCQEEKILLSTSFLFLFRSANYDELNHGRTLPSPMPKFLLGRCQRPSGLLLHQAPIRIWVRGWVFYSSFCRVCDWGTRGLSRTPITDYPDPFRLPTDQKIFGSKPCPGGWTIAWFYQLRMAHGLGSKDAVPLM